MKFEVTDIIYKMEVKKCSLTDEQFDDFVEKWNQESGRCLEIFYWNRIGKSKFACKCDVLDWTVARHDIEEKLMSYLDDNYMDGKQSKQTKQQLNEFFQMMRSESVESNDEVSEKESDDDESEEEDIQSEISTQTVETVEESSDTNDTLDDEHSESSDSKYF